MRAALGLVAGVSIALLAVWLVPDEPEAEVLEPTVVTLTGSIGATNRGAYDPFTDATFRVHGIEFAAAYAFTRAELRALPQQTVTVQYPDWPRPVAVSGPTLADILSKVEAAGQTVHVQALDGYAVSFDRDAVSGPEAVLALDANGDPLAIGGRGPAWLVYPPGSIEGHTDDGDAGLVWSVFHIRVE